MDCLKENIQDLSNYNPKTKYFNWVDFYKNQFNLCHNKRHLFNEFLNKKFPYRFSLIKRCQPDLLKSWAANNINYPWTGLDDPDGHFYYLMCSDESDLLAFKLCWS